MPQLFRSYSERSPLLPHVRGRPPTPKTSSALRDDMSLSAMCEELKAYFVEHVEAPQTFASLKRLPALTKLSTQLSENNHNPATVAALLWCKAQFTADNGDAEYGLASSRGLACEIVACNLVSSLSAADALQYLCYEIPLPTADDADRHVEEISLLGGSAGSVANPDPELHAVSGYTGLNTLEIAIMADAKKFISHRPVQKIINGIWDGKILFWKKLEANASMKPHFYNKRTADPFCRLRVPKYQKTFEALFFAILLALYYAVLIERNPSRITGTEAALIVFFAAFTVDELSAIRDSGLSFYLAEFWSWFDLLVIAIGIGFLVLRVLGIAKQSPQLTTTAFDILSLEAIILTPRVFSLISLNPYFGVLIPCLKQMMKDFLRFLILVVVIYVGFLTTFCLLARDNMAVSDMSWMLVYVFFGSSYVGFDAMRKISPVMGPPLMLIFVTLTNILLITSLISLLSNSLTNMMNNAREEYLFMFSIMVLEASTSAHRMVYFYPPLNLLPLILLRPLRLILPARSIRRYRVGLLKLCHYPMVAAIMAFERVAGGDRRGRPAAWGPAGGNPSNHVGGLGLGLGMRSLKRNRGDRLLSEWAGRLTGAKLGLGGGGMGASPAAPGAPSPRLDDEPSGSRERAEDYDELRQIRTALADLSRRLDDVLRQQ